MNDIDVGPFIAAHWQTLVQSAKAGLMFAAFMYVVLLPLLGFLWLLAKRRQNADMPIKLTLFSAIALALTLFVLTAAAFGASFGAGMILFDRALSREPIKTGEVLLVVQLFCVGGASLAAIAFMPVPILLKRIAQLSGSAARAKSESSADKS